MNTPPRVRFAPSPTGYLHIGGLRTALYNYLFAKKEGGSFIVRIEDTDRERFIEDATQRLLDSLIKCGLTPDEGVYLDGSSVKQKGDRGPYIQSERLDLYKKYAEQLLTEGHAYRCFCTSEELEQMRAAQQASKQMPKYNRRCLKLSEEEVRSKLAAGTPHVLRLKVPEGQTRVTDAVRGTVTFNNIEIDDQVLMKSDGFPTYHLANVVDDHLMEITHVIRGEEWLPSTPKHVILYQMFSWNLPIFAHIPLLLSRERAKLSKRQGDMAVEDYLAKGYLPEAITNFVSLLGWNPGTEQEIFSLLELTAAFSLERVNKAGAVMDLDRLNWFNSQHLRRIMAEQGSRYQEILAEVKRSLIEAGAILSDQQVELILRMEAERLTTTKDLPNLACFVWQLRPYEPSLLIFKKSDRTKTLHGLRAIQTTLGAMAGDWHQAEIKKNLEITQEQAGLTPGDVFWPIRVALSGLQASPPPEQIAEILGKEETLLRIKQAKKALNET